MFRKLILALAAVAAFATTAVVTSNDAEAFPRGIRGPGIHRPIVARPVIGHRPIIRRPIIGIRPIFRPRPGIIVGHCWKHPWLCRRPCGWHRPCVGWPRPIYRPVIVPTPVAVAPSYRPAPGPCTCLSKEYLQDGSVLFKDNCTKESAIAPSPTAQRR